MEYMIGLLLALAVAAFAAITGFGRDRAFYPTVLIIVAHYYVLFAAIGASGKTLALEIAAASVFLLIAVIGFKTSFWLVAAAIAAHGIFDVFHRRLIEDPGVPRWWPGFCMAFDVALGAYLGVRQYRAVRLQQLSF